jgi:hypothetical protein
LLIRCLDLRAAALCIRDLHQQASTTTHWLSSTATISSNSPDLVTDTK